MGRRGQGAYVYVVLPRGWPGQPLAPGRRREESTAEHARSYGPRISNVRFLLILILRARALTVVLAPPYHTIRMHTIRSAVRTHTPSESYTFRAGSVSLLLVTYSSYIFTSAASHVDSAMANCLFSSRDIILE